MYRRTMSHGVSPYTFVTCFVILLTASCNRYDIYEDNFHIPPPPKTDTRHVFPGILEVSITQSAPPSLKMPSDSARTVVNLRKLSPLITGDLTMLIKLYNKEPLIVENLGYMNITRVKEFATLEETEIDLGTSFKMPLKPELVEIQILDSGLGELSQHFSRGYYSGIYSLVNEADTLWRGAIVGTIDFEGQIRFEFKDFREFRFVTGHAVENLANIDVFGEVIEADGDVYSPFVGKFWQENELIKGAVPINSSTYDTIQIYAVRQVF